MTKERLQEIEDMLNATTGGEWFANDIPFNNSYDPYISTKDGTYIAQTTYDTLSNTCEHNIDADTLFIAASKTIVAELLTEIKRLKEKYGEGGKPLKGKQIINNCYKTHFGFCQDCKHSKYYCEDDIMAADNSERCDNCLENLEGFEKK